MFNFKEKYKEAVDSLAPLAVEYVEDNLTGIKGKEKKKAAVDFILAALPIPLPIKFIVKLVLMPLIDLAIESALEKMKERRADGAN